MRQKVFFANHSSNLDFPLIWAVLPADLRNRTRPAAAKDYWQVGGIRGFLSKKVFHAIYLERRKVVANPLEPLNQALKEKATLIIFPEGGRSCEGDIQDFKGGLYHLARENPEVDFVPVYVKNLNRVLPKGEVLPLPLLTSVRFGAPLRLNEGEKKEEFLDRAKRALEELKI